MNFRDYGLICFAATAGLFVLWTIIGLAWIYIKEWIGYSDD